MSAQVRSAKLIKSLHGFALSGEISHLETKNGEEKLFAFVSSEENLTPKSEKLLKDILVFNQLLPQEKGVVINPKSRIKEIFSFLLVKSGKPAVNLGVVLIEGKNAFFNFQLGELWICRKNIVTCLADSSAVPVFVAGEIQKDDLFLFGDKSFFKGLAPEVIQKALKNQFEEGKEVLERALEAGALATGSGLLFLVGERYPEKTEKVEEAQPTEKEKRFVLLRHKVAGFIDWMICLLPKRRIYVQEEDFMKVGSGRRKKTVLGSIFLVVLLLLAVAGVMNAGKVKKREAYREKLILAQHQLTEAESLVGLDDTKARDLFLASREILKEIKDQGADDDKVEALEEDLSASEGKILGEYLVKGDLFLDIGVLEKEFKPSRVFVSGNKIVLFQKEKEEAIAVDLSDKNSRKLAGIHDLGGIVSVSEYSGNYYALTQKGIYRVDDEFELVAEKAWEEAQTLSLFSGNIYVADSKNIIRYQGASGRFSQGSNWLAEEEGGDLGRVSQIVIDGSIWLLQGSGEISRYAQGVEKAFGFSGVRDFPFKSDFIFSLESTSYLYLLDREGQRIIVVDKGGAFKAQYKSPDFVNTLGFSVLESDRKLIYVMGSRLLTFELRHL